MTCPKCEANKPHYSTACDTVCNDKLPHDVLSTYKDYGYYRGQCKKCNKVWEVDSSG